MGKIVDSDGVLWFHVDRPCIRTSVRPSVVRPTVFSFPDDTSDRIFVSG